MKQIELYVTIVPLERNELVLKSLFRSNETMAKALVSQHIKITATLLLV